MDFRLANEQDIPRLAELYAIMFNHIEGKTSHTKINKETYATRKLGLKNHWIFVAEENGDILATISLRKRAKTIGYVCDAIGNQWII